MKLLNLVLPTILVAALSSCNGCKRGNEVDVPGGKGGDGTLRITLAHHSKKLDTAGIVYMAYGIDAPGDGKYVDSAKCVNQNGQHVATFNNLRKGQYYLNGKAFDTEQGAMIAGGNGYTLKEETTIDYELAVSTHLP